MNNSNQNNNFGNNLLSSDSSAPNPFGADLSTQQGRRQTSLKILQDSQSLNKQRIAGLSADLKYLNNQIDELKARNDPSYQTVLDRKMKVLGEYQVLVEQQELITQEIEYRKEQKMIQEQQKFDNSTSAGMNSPSQPSAAEQQKQIEKLQAEVQHQKDLQKKRRREDILLGRPQNTQDAVVMGCCEGCLGALF